MSDLNLGNTQTSGFTMGDNIDLSKPAKNADEFVFKFVDFAARMLDYPPHKRNWQTHVMTLYDEGVRILEEKQASGE